jgi:hypothetical protein
VPGRWPWIILPKMGAGPKVTGEAKHRTRERAVESCIEEINNGLKGADMPRGPKREKGPAC